MPLRASLGLTTVSVSHQRIWLCFRGARRFSARAPAGFLGGFSAGGEQGGPTCRQRFRCSERPVDPGGSVSESCVSLHTWQLRRFGRAVLGVGTGMGMGTHGGAHTSTCFPLQLLLNRRTETTLKITPSS